MRLVWRQRGVLVPARALTATLEMLGCAAKKAASPPQRSAPTKPAEGASETSAADED